VSTIWRPLARTIPVAAIATATNTAAARNEARTTGGVCRAPERGFLNDRLRAVALIERAV
jgi:hypothetical protein